MRRDIFDSDSRSFSVRLNGNLVSDVVWADEETGTAELYEHEWRLAQRGERTGRTFIVKGAIKIINHEAATVPQTDLFGGFYNYSGY